MVRVFKGLNDKRKSYYAVTGTGDIFKALYEVAKHTKTSYANANIGHWKWAYGTIAPYEKDMDGLWFAADYAKGQPCIIVYK